MTPAAEDHYAERLRQLLHLPVTRLSVAGAQHGYQHLTATLADGRAVFAKAAVGFGAGLARLHAAGADAFGAPWPGRIASLPL
jgi:fructosamine-3-kinase